MTSNPLNIPEIIADKPYRQWTRRNFWKVIGSFSFLGSVLWFVLAFSINLLHPVTVISLPVIFIIGTAFYFILIFVFYQKLPKINSSEKSDPLPQKETAPPLATKDLKTASEAGLQQANPWLSVKARWRSIFPFSSANSGHKRSLFVTFFCFLEILIGLAFGLPLVKAIPFLENGFLMSIVGHNPLLANFTALTLLLAQMGMVIIGFMGLLRVRAGWVLNYAVLAYLSIMAGLLFISFIIFGGHPPFLAKVILAVLLLMMWGVCGFLGFRLNQPNSKAHYQIQ